VRARDRCEHRETQEKPLQMPHRSPAILECPQNTVAKTYGACVGTVYENCIYFANKDFAGKTKMSQAVLDKFQEIAVA
jgi:hypothetical protein